ncbi:MAG: DUF3187 family protein [Nitrospirae bacterium]|nr:DUF3187 family protein [Nitrospirota bacterium]
MTIVRRLVVLAVAIACASAASAEPLHIRNGFPPFQGVAAPPLMSAGCENSISLNATWSSTYMTRKSREWDVMIDLETVATEIALEKKIADSWGLSLDIPAISNNSGVLDNPVNAYHRAFGFPDYGRSTRPDNAFLYSLKRNGKIVIEGRAGGTGLGDIRMGLKKTIFSCDASAAIFGFAEAPTGDPDGGFGNGSWDFGAAALVNAQLLENIAFTANIGYAFPGPFRAHETVDLQNFVYGGADMEWRYSAKTAFNAQVLAQQSPLRNTGIREIDDVSVLLALGASYAVNGRTTVEASFTEDPNTAGAPDFMLSFGLKRRF